MNFLRKSLPSLSRSIFSMISSSKSSPTPLFSRSISFSVSKPNPIPNPSSQWRRFYSHDRGMLQHFCSRRLYYNPRTILLVVILGGGAIVTTYYSHLETVPYTKRAHFVLLSPSVERKLGEYAFQYLKDTELKGKILPAIHPDSVRVRLISKDIIGALQRGLRHNEPQWGDLGYASDVPERVVDPEKSKDTLAKIRKKEGWNSDDEILDDQWVHHNKKKAADVQSSRSVHFEGLNWEVLVVKDQTFNAFCLPGGKIVVFTGLLDHYRSDAEIATVLGHEVAHVIARHGVEMLTRILWLSFVKMIIVEFFCIPDLINAMSKLLLELPLSRRKEIEADYIGLLLMASAGYDPRVAPTVYEKMSRICRESANSSLTDYLSTHPSSKKRAKLLSQAQVMKEALSMYNEAISGNVVAGFL